MMVCPSGLLAVVVRSTPWSAVLLVFTGCPPIRAAHTTWTDSMTSSQVDPAKTRPTQFVAPSVSFRHRRETFLESDTGLEDDEPALRWTSLRQRWARCSSIFPIGFRLGCCWLFLPTTESH